MKKMLCLALLALFMDVQVKAAPEALDTLNINLNIQDQEPVYPPIGPLTEGGDENAKPESSPGAMEHMESYPEPEPNNDWQPRDNTETIEWKFDMKPVKLTVPYGTKIVFQPIEMEKDGHNVVEVHTRKDLHHCTGYKPVPKGKLGPFTKMPEPGTHFYTCPVVKDHKVHCKHGMQAEITVEENSQNTETIEWKFDMKPVKLTVPYGTKIVFEPIEMEKEGHNLVEVHTRKDLHHCTGYKPVPKGKLGPFTEMPKPGTHFYTCPVVKEDKNETKVHCKHGMQAEIMVEENKETIDWKLDMEFAELTVIEGTKIVFEYNNRNPPTWQQPHGGHHPTWKQGDKVLHNVKELPSRKDLDHCTNFPQPIIPEQGPKTITPTVGTHWYTCTIGDHCAQHNMKAEITVIKHPGRQSIIKNLSNSNIFYHPGQIQNQPGHNTDEEITYGG